MPPNQPGGDIIILESGVAVGRTPGTGSLVCECVYMFVCMCVCVCAWQLGSLWPHHHCVSQPQPVQTCTLSCQPQCTFSASHTHTHTLAECRYPVEKGKTPELTYQLLPMGLKSSSFAGSFQFLMTSCQENKKNLNLNYAKSDFRKRSQTGFSYKRVECCDFTND